MSAHWFQPVPQRTFFSRNDPEDPRLGDWAQSIEKTDDVRAGDFVIIGYPDDEGIKLNEGRIGASQGPDQIRRSLYKMTPSLSSGEKIQILDLGNLKTDAPLAERHDRAQTTVLEILRKGAKLICLGGGHDYGFSDMAAFSEITLEKKKKPFIINFDAHLDVRSDQNNQNSGTSFYRLLEKYAGKIDFFEVGIQDWCNSRIHREWATKKGAEVLTFDEIIEAPSFYEIFSKRVASKISPDHCLALSVDIDFFPNSVAPGASQIFPVGVDPSGFLKVWKRLMEKHQPPVVAFYEVSPPLDLDHRTSQLAAILCHQFLFTTSSR